MGVQLTRSTCDCGTMKTAEHDYMVCDHCDLPCSGWGCVFCGRYYAAVSRRVSPR